MSESQNTVECSTHGTTEATYVCQHLIRGERLGFNLGYNPENPDQLYPDAWCDQCEKIMQAEGGWNNETEHLAAVKLVCANCYEEARERNWLQNDDLLHDLIESSCRYLEEKQKAFVQNYKLDDYDRWDWSQDTGKLIFSKDGRPMVEADIQFAGSYSTESNSWMWAWANQDLDEKVKAASRKAKEIGEDLGLRQLVAGLWDATEVDGWEMTAVLANAARAIGAYRTPKEGGFTYMVVVGVRWVRGN